MKLAMKSYLMVLLQPKLQLEQTDSIFWVYESDNNKSCIDAGMCMGISDTIIEDGDNFVFKYTDTFE